MKIHTANTTNTNRPHLECPNCGQTVLSIEEWKAISRRYKIYTCPYCQCRYRIPKKCQNIQVGAALCLTFAVIILYAKVCPWIFSQIPLSQKLADGVVILGAAMVGIGPAGKVGEKMAYKYPLEKVE